MRTARSARSSPPATSLSVRAPSQVSTNALPGATYRVDLRPEHALDYAVRATTSPNGDVTIELTARGEGTHSFALRTDNLTVASPSQTRTLRRGQSLTLTWKARMQATDAPWVAVVIPDNH